jgi:hypothetical protein
MDEYQFVRDNPIDRDDPLGLQTSGPSSGPATNQTLAHDGNGTWGTGDHQVTYSFSMQDISGDARHQTAMGTSGNGIFTVIKVKKGKTCPCDSFRWIQYSEARQNGKVYTPPGGYPWSGMDRFPGNGGRTDPDTYTFTDQAAVDSGNGYGGRVKDLYDPSGADSIFIDWASAGGQRNWSHYSVVVLICQKAGKDYRLGGLMYQWSVDGNGTMTYGAADASDKDIQAWDAGLKAGFPNYVGQTYKGTP